MATRPGKRLEETMENHHAMNGNIHYFDWAIFKFAKCNYQRLSPLNQFWECEALSEGRTAGQLPSRLWAWQSLTKQDECGAVMCFEYVQTNVKFWSLPSGYD